MTRISGMILDIEKSSTDPISGWYLYFTEGLFEAPGVSKFVEPSILRLKKKDYSSTSGGLPRTFHIYFNPLINKYTVIENSEIDECEDTGYSIGGFMVKNCKLYFVYPKDCEDIEYRRPFAEEYNEAFNKLEINCDTPDEVLEEICGEFNRENFNNDYKIECLVFTSEDDQFCYVEFDSEEFEADTPSMCQVP
jgi:hypothetical protein